MRPHAAAITMNALPLAPRALYEEVAESLRQRIFSRELAPGSWIDELKIAEDYGISRTPLREALKVLAAEGLVTMKVRRGAYVTEVSDQDLAEVYHLLSLLESDAARRRGHPGQRRPSWRSCRPCTRSWKPPCPAARTGCSSSGSTSVPHAPAGDRRQPLARQMVADLRKVMKLNRHNSLLKAGRIDESLAEHLPSWPALARRDAARNSP
jgi:DNA-binding transcriptional regulator YhcF (GntR family)